MKEVSLNEGDRLRILPETNYFYLKCCTCKMIHRIVVKHEKKGIILEFHEFKKQISKLKKKGGIKRWEE